MHSPRFTQSDNELFTCTSQHNWQCTAINMRSVMYHHLLSRLVASSRPWWLLLASMRCWRRWCMFMFLHGGEISCSLPIALSLHTSELLPAIAWRELFWYFGSNHARMVLITCNVSSTEWSIHWCQHKRSFIHRWIVVLTKIHHNGDSI